MTRKFRCVDGCSDCCINREYYPSVEYGKIGVLVLPEEKPALERLARKKNVDLKIIPRIAVGRGSPEKIIAYQMMGKKEDGDLCPFLDTESGDRSPHGGFSCAIYSDRPLACRAYPVIDAGRAAELDGHCQFCRKFETTGASAAGLQSEIEALAKIKASVTAGEELHVWRYATATGNSQDREKLLPKGWVIES